MCHKCKKLHKHMKQLQQEISPLAARSEGPVPGQMKRVQKHKAIKTTGKFRGKSNTLGHGGRAAQLRAQGVPGGVIGKLARAAHAAKGQKNYHGK